MSEKLKEIADDIGCYEHGDQYDRELSVILERLIAEVRRLDTELSELNSASRRTANIASCLASGIQPD
jgi:hypothetical protein